MKFSKDELRAAMRLYAVTDRRWLKAGERLADVCRAVLQNGATFLQVREKDIAPEQFAEEARELQALSREFHAPLVVNDSVEIALAMDADGVHVGQSDICGRDIRAMIGTDKILGISAGTVEEAIAAERAGADYIGVGAVFGTGTKKNARNLGVEQLRTIAKSVRIPVVAIGGIDIEKLPLLSDSGIDGVAVVSAIFAAESPAEATRWLSERIREVLQK